MGLPLWDGWNIALGGERAAAILLDAKRPQFVDEEEELVGLESLKGVENLLDLLAVVGVWARQDAACLLDRVAGLSKGAA